MRERERENKGEKEKIKERKRERENNREKERERERERERSALNNLSRSSNSSSVINATVVMETYSAYDIKNTESSKSFSFTSPIELYSTKTLKILIRMIHF